MLPHKLWEMEKKIKGDRRWVVSLFEIHWAVTLAPFLSTGNQFPSQRDAFGRRGLAQPSLRDFGRDRNNEISGAVTVCLPRIS